MRNAGNKKDKKSISSASVKEAVMKGCFLAAAVFSIVAVVSIFIFLFLEGSPAIAKVGLFKFIFGTVWDPVYHKPADTFDAPLKNSYGIFTFIVGSVYATGGAVLIGGGLGFLAAVFLAMFCPKKLKSPLTQVINLLAGIPSVIYGFFGMRVLIPALGKFAANGSGAGLLTVSLVLGIMILPTVTALTKTGLEAVDKSYLEGAMALGATKEQAVFRVVVPAAKSSILAAMILGVGRAIGETMAVKMVAGNGTGFPGGLLDGFRTMTVNIILEMAYAEEFHMATLVGTGCVLFVFILIINVAFSIVIREKGSPGGRSKKVRKTRGNGKTGAIPEAVPEAVFEEGGGAPKPAADGLRDDALKPDYTAKEFVFSEQPEHENRIGRRKLKLTDGYSTAAAVERAERGKSVKIQAALHKSLKYSTFAASGIGVAALVYIIAFVFINGIPYITAHLLFGEFKFSGAPSILPSILATLLMVGVSSLIAFPLGIFTAIYLVEYTKRGSRLVKLVRLAVEILGGIPSIVYGLFGMIFFCDLLGFGTSIIAGCCTISLMIIPATVRATEESLKSVPDSYREGSYALGTGKFRTIYKVVLPPALPGILAAIILGIGKMFSESAPFLFTMGSGRQGMPKKGLASAGSTLAVLLYAFASEGKYVNEAYATACILIMIVLALNIISTLLVRRLQKSLLGKKA